MRRVAKLAVVGTFSAAAVGACQGDYPLDPTPCDDWCYHVERTMCWGEDPAECVRECERFGRPKDPECLPLWDAALACVGELPDGAGCGSVYPMPCEAERIAQMECQWPSERPEVTDPSQ